MRDSRPNPTTFLKGQIIVSVQANDTDPLGSVDHLVAMAKTCVMGGAQGLRLAQGDCIQAFKTACPDIPVIGITKPRGITAYPLNEVYITPTWESIVEVAEAGADIIAMDATQRPRPSGEELPELIARAKATYPQCLLMADIATLEDGQEAEILGFDWISTTLSGYTLETEMENNGFPNYDLLLALTQWISCPVIMEGRIWEPVQAEQALSFGAHAVVVGSAITRPQLITQRFCEAVKTNSSFRH